MTEGRKDRTQASKGTRALGARVSKRYTQFQRRHEEKADVLNENLDKM